MKIDNINDYKDPLKKVFGFDWEGSNKETSGDGTRWSYEEQVQVLKLAFAGLSVHQISELMPSRSAYSVELRLGKFACALIDGANRYGRNYSKRHNL